MHLPLEEHGALSNIVEVDSKLLGFWIRLSGFLLENMVTDI